MILFEQIQNLYSNHLYDDVIFLASTSLTNSDRNSDLFTSAVRYQIYYLHGMANFHIGDYKVAETSFNTALNLRKIYKLKSKKGQDIQSEAELRFVLHNCYIKMNQQEEALAALELIPLSQRTPQMNMSYLKLMSHNKQNKNEKLVIATCKEILKTNPMSITAIKTLIQNGSRFDEIDQLIKSVLPSYTSIEWLGHLIRAYVHAHNCDYKSAIESYRIVSDPFWLLANVEILSSIGEAYYLKGDYQRAMATFKQIHEMDNNYTNKMAIYAFILYREDNSADLKKLAMQLMSSSKHSADSWIVLGFYQMISPKYNQALAFAQKAMALEPTNTEALMLRGLSSMEIKSESAEALNYFRSATQYSPSHFEPYKCIVDYYLKNESVQSIQFATAVASEINSVLPSPRTFALYASILIKDSTNFEKTKTLLENAVQMDTECLDAVLLLAKLHKGQGNIQAAIDVLLQYPPSNPSYKYHQLMADTLMLSKDRQNALDHSVLALRLDPLLPKVLNFESSAEVLDESDWYSGSAMPARNLFRMEGVLAESPAYEQDLILDS